MTQTPMAKVSIPVAWSVSDFGNWSLIIICNLEFVFWDFLNGAILLYLPSTSCILLTHLCPAFGQPFSCRCYIFQGIF